MLGFTLLSIAGAACLSGVQARNQPRQLPSLPSYQSYINVTRNDRTAVTLKIDTTNTSARNATSPYLYGLMHEVSGLGQIKMTLADFIRILATLVMAESMQR